MRRLNLFKILGLSLFLSTTSFAQTSPQDGSMLWFTEMQPANATVKVPSSLCISQESASFSIVENELKAGLEKLFPISVAVGKKIKDGALVVGTSENKQLKKYISDDEFRTLGDDGYIIRSFHSPELLVIAGNSDKAVLYGSFHFLRLLQTSPVNTSGFNIVEIPSYQRRILNHWDNLDRTIERGYAGYSLWKWEELPEKISPRYEQYARANASIGINGTVLNNVNANPLILRHDYLEKVKVLADLFRPYGIQVYLSINFSSPSALGGLKTSDPLNAEVIEWWTQKADEIYKLIPDFGGFLVKANSEGLPGPQDFGRTHADGANMLAKALEAHHGLVMWRAFVYNPEGNDRAKQAYDEFVPLDGQFHKNVIIQVKNGPVDFQPREPFSPLFGAMQHTTLMPELQITQEYLGFSDHLVYLGTLFKEFLEADTYVAGRNSTTAKITDGSLFHDSITAIAGVANIGEDTNWCGHHFAQANWYAFGRLAWNHELSAKEIATEWMEQTFTHDSDFVSEMGTVMMQSREAVVNYMTPLGLHHLMGWSHHYGPEPWCVIPGARPDWLPTYYHKADSLGIGFNRSSSGSNAVAQYAEPLRSLYDDPALCPDEYLLWFHHLPWDYPLMNGKDLWTELCYRYSSGVDDARRFQESWEHMKAKVDEQRFREVQEKLATQVREAIWWRDACLLYFQTFSKREIPWELERPVHQLEELKQMKFDLKSHN